MVMPMFCYLRTINTIQLLVLFLESKVAFGNFLFSVISHVV